VVEHSPLRAGGLIPERVIPDDLKMVPDASLLRA